MARTKQTARRSTGGKAPRKQLAVFVSIDQIVKTIRLSHVEIYLICGKQL